MACEVLAVRLLLEQEAEHTVPEIAAAMNRLAEAKKRERIYPTADMLYKAVSAETLRSVSWVRRILRIATLVPALQAHVKKPLGLSMGMAAGECVELPPAQQVALAADLREVRTPLERRRVLQRHLPDAWHPQVPGEWRKRETQGA